MRIRMDILQETTTVLAGALSGRKAYSELIELTSSEPQKPSAVFLDFGNVDVATASYLRESVLAYRDYVRRKHSKWYPVVANCNDLVEEELRVLVASQGNAIMLCVLDEADNLQSSYLLGDLDPKQRLTYELVQKHQDADAATLLKVHGSGENVMQTAWNNRLAALVRLGLLVETRDGRSKRYRPLFVED